MTYQRRQDDNKNKIFAFEGGGLGGREERSSKNACFHGKRHDNRILKVEMLLSRNFVVIAQAPNLQGALQRAIDQWSENPKSASDRMAIGHQTALEDT